MKCYYHPSEEAIATCSNCGKGICQTCNVNLGGRILCPQCLSKPVQSSPPTKPTNILSIVSVALALFGFCLGTIFFWIPAAITGYMARKQIAENPDQEGLIFANIGMWVGTIMSAITIISIVCYLVFVVVLAISGSISNY